MQDPADRHETLVTLTADIVSAHVSNNTIKPEELPKLIANVFGALDGAGSTPAPQEELTPAVPIRGSVKKDAISCLDCGKKMKMLKRHLATEHGITPDEYRAKWNLGPDYPMVAANYAETRRDLAKKIGLGRKPGQRRGRRKA
ncbi:MucR family transcriptional regulator [Porphyrobacter sp. YT40]|uniref:MucR family transcriptional regulator n=1 Tax=Porphyrobacter sp. YT40 TaxID=2547601 RepID=UPI001144B8C1|nr:MucR family transcriptional regulator [Porphyrobacter sp. YT40]QDH36328.1 transcriptional regulator [Porphyrobacter sp. YT40]